MNDNFANSNPAGAETIFSAAIVLAPAERAAYLAGACGEDPRLRHRVEALLRAHETAGGFLPEQPRAGPGLTMAAARGIRRAATIGPEPLGETIGPYRLLEKIGEGGCGVVYMAEQTESVRRHVALKVVKLGMDTKQVVARFEAERQALALMDHPNIAKVLDAGATEAGRPYFVMELVRGIKITDFCDSNRLSTRERLDLFIHVCRAVQHAHQKGIIHRDIKPSNILVTVSDGVAVAKVIDFGIAKATNRQPLTDKTIFTAVAQFLGTPAYMSPEQAEITSLDIDTRTDTYSLGVLLYELLTGKTPFDTRELLATGLDEMRRTIREKEPTRPSTRLSTMTADDLTKAARRRQTDPPTLIGAVQGDLDWIVMKCLEKDRARRYETVNGLVRDIERHLANEPVSARPPSTAYRLQKFIRRHRAGAGSALVVATVMVTGIAVSIREAVTARRAEREQHRSRTEAEQARNQLSRSVHTMEMREIRRAEEWFETGESAKAIAHLAIVLRQTPTNRIAVQRLMAALSELQFARPAFAPLRHSGRLNWAQFSHDGRLVATTSADGTARVWNAYTGRPVAGPFPHAREVNMADFSRDSRYLVTASQDGTARAWEIRTGEPIGPPLNHENDIWNAHFSPDGRWVVTASMDHTARVWDARSGQLRFPPLRCDDAVTEAEFSSDGTRVVTASRDYTARIWDAVTGQQLALLKHANPVSGAHFSPDGERVVTGCLDGTGRVWNGHTGQTITPAVQHNARIDSAEFSPDGRLVATTSWDGITKIWDAQTGQLNCPPIKHRDRVRSAQFSADGRRVVTASSDQTARVWDTQTGEAITEPLREEMHVYYAEFHPDGRRVLTAANGTAAQVWDISIAPRAPRTLVQPGTINGLEFSSDGTRFIAASEHDALIWEVASGKLVTRLGGNRAINFAAFSPDGNRVITAARDNFAQVWDAQTGAPVGAALPHSNLISCARFSPDSRRVATASLDKSARIWDARTGQPLTGPLSHADPVTEARFSPDGSRLLTAAGRNALVWDASTGRLLLPPLRHANIIQCAKISGDGRRVLTACVDCFEVWDAFTGQLIDAPRPVDRPTLVSFPGADGARVLTGVKEGNTCLWDTQTGWQLRAFPAGIAVAQSRTDRLKLAGLVDWEKRIRIWDLETGLPLNSGFKLPNECGLAQLSPDGQYLLTVCLDSESRAQVWELTDFPLPVPTWVPELAEAVVGQRVDPEGRTEFVPCQRFLEIKAQLKSSPNRDAYQRWADWFFAGNESH